MATWTTSQCPFAIVYTPQVLEDIRMAVVSAFHAPSHGGLEIGGILLGSHYADRISITNYRPMLCEHAFGPTFQLSADDHVRLTAAIAGAQAAGQTIVGWFHSHTRAGVLLSEADLEIHNRHFVDPWQVALVLKPVPLNPTLCGFFFREADGSIHSNESYHEFELGKRTAQDLQAKMGSPELDGPFANVPSAPQSHRRPRENAEFLQTSEELAAALPPMDESPNREAPIASPAAEVSQRWERPRRAQPRRKSGGWYVHGGRVLAGAVIVFAIGVAYTILSSSDTRVQTTRAQPAADQAFGAQATGGQLATGQALGLKMQRQGPDLALTWNRNLPEALGATAGLLTINDGPKRMEMGLSAEQLRSANILIAPESDQVEVQLVVLLPNQRILSESGIFVLPGQRLPAQTTTGPVVPNATVPWSTYTGAQIRSKSPELKASKAFVAPPDRDQAPEPQLTDEPPALKGIGPAERTQPIPLASLRTFTVIPPPPPAIPAGQMSSGSTFPSGPSAAGRDGANAQPAELISRTNPVYPAKARERRMIGVVVLEVLVGTNGQVKELKAISGLQVFQQAARDAVKEWVYRPAMLNGKVIEARVRVEIQFREGM